MQPGQGLTGDSGDAAPGAANELSNGIHAAATEQSDAAQSSAAVAKAAMPALPPRRSAIRSSNGSNSVTSVAGNGPHSSQSSSSLAGTKNAARTTTPSSSTDMPSPGASPTQSQPPNRSRSSTKQPAGLGKPTVSSSSASSSSKQGPSGIKAMPILPVRSTNNSGTSVMGVIDPEEPEATQRLRANVHDIRVKLIRAARRLGYEHDNGLVKQVLYRLYLAEKLKEPFRKGARRPDAALLAARDASRLEAEQGPTSPLGLNVKILLIGLTGTGKTQLIRSLLSMDSSSSSDERAGSGSCSSSDASQPLDVFNGGTKHVEVATGCVLGINLTLIDTPGLTASAAGTAANAGVLRALKKAFKQHQPDLVLYVDRFDQPTRAGGELPVLQAVTNACGPHIWLNTIVALTHAGSAQIPRSEQGQQSWDGYSQQRSQLLQLIIRSASGDARLMNPIAFVESHPGCKRNAQGLAIIPSGLPWQQHMLVLIVSAKLLADAEAALQMSPEAPGQGRKQGLQAGLDPASMRQLMGRPDGPPVRYLMTQLTTFSQPLTYPDHSAIMELRNAKRMLRKLKGWRDRKELFRQTRFRLLQMQQMQRRQQRSTDLLCKATRAGGKLQLAEPRTATRVRPSVQPPVSHRYRALEPSAGWIVRPNLEPHGMDNADSVEGFLAEKAGVMRRSDDQLLVGQPYRVSSSAQANKEQLLLQARGEMSVYHDLPGLASTTVSADIQTSGAAGSQDMLIVLRAETQRRGFPVAANSPSAGVLVARLAQECRPDRGPLAAGVRVQDCVRFSGPGGAPVELDMSLGKMFCQPNLDREDAWGGNAELRTDVRQLLGTEYSSPLSLSGSVMGHKGEILAAVSAALQVQQGRRSGIGGKVQLNSRGIATMGLQVRSDGSQLWGLVGFIPLINLGWDALGRALAGGRGDGSTAGDDATAEKQQQQPASK